MKQNILLKANITLNDGNYTDNEISTLYKELKNVDKKTLRKYFNRQSLKNYDNDLDLYLDVLRKLYNVIENNSKYHNIIQ